MKTKSTVSGRSRALIAAAVVAAVGGIARADDLYWDADGSTTTAVGGSATWTVASSSLWRNGSTTGTLQTWTANSNMFLPTAAGNITLSGTAAVNEIVYVNTSNT